MQESIVDIIDLTNTDHMAAVHSLFTTGLWPESFQRILALAYFPSYWQAALAHKLAMAYLDLQVKSAAAEGPSTSMKLQQLTAAAEHAVAELSAALAASETEKDL